VLAGMVAGALVTLMPDRSAFLILTGLLLVPPAIGILATSTDHDHVSAAILIVVFGGFEAIVHQRAHRTLVEHVLTKVRAVRQHQELQESLGRVKLLSGLLPICAGCKKIRDATATEQSVARLRYGMALQPSSGLRIRCQVAQARRAMCAIPSDSVAEDGGDPPSCSSDGYVARVVARLRRRRWLGADPGSQFPIPDRPVDSRRGGRIAKSRPDRNVP